MPTTTYNNADIVLTTSAATIASVGSLSSLLITRITATNTDVLTHYVTIYRVIGGGSTSASNQIVSPRDWPGKISPGQTIAIPLTGHSLINGQSLQALADANSVVNLSVSFTQIDP